MCYSVVGILFVALGLLRLSAAKLGAAGMHLPFTRAMACWRVWCARSVDGAGTLCAGHQSGVCAKYVLT